MSEKAIFETLIADTSALKEIVQNLSNLFSALPPIIEREHQAIKKGDALEIEETLLQKEKIAEERDILYQGLCQLGDEVSYLYQKVFQEAKTGKTGDIQAIISLIMELRDKMETKENLAVQILNHQLSGLTKTVETFRQVSAKIKPLIEMNKYVLKNTIQHCQESYRFWQEVKTNQLSPYNHQGVQKGGEASSAFNVKV